MPILPTSARALLGEDLTIPDVPTVWCGTEWGRKEAIDAFARRGGARRVRREAIVLARVFGAAWVPTCQRRGAPSASASTGGARISSCRTSQHSGWRPSTKTAALTAKPASLRVFAAWTPEGYVVMPGALTRVAQDETVRALSMQSGAASKDTWVLASAPVDGFSLLKRTDVALPIRRAGDEAPSRAMDNLFWLGRYVERAENLVRVLRAVVQRLGDDTATTRRTAASELARRLLLPQGQASAVAVSASGKGDNARLSTELHALDLCRRVAARACSVCCKPCNARRGRCATASRSTPGARSTR